MTRCVLLFAGLLCAVSLSAAPFLVVDDPIQQVLPGGTAFFNGSVTFDEFSPLGAGPSLSPAVPAGFTFSPALALAGPFASGEVYSGPLFLIQVPGDALPQIYSAMATVEGPSNAVEIRLTVGDIPEPATFGLVGVAIAVAILRRRNSFPAKR
jgi:hypothetical protein